MSQKMDGLQKIFYESRPQLPQMDFNDTNDSITILTAYKSSNKLISELVEEHLIGDVAGSSIKGAINKEGLSTAIAIVPLINKRNPYCLDISQKNFHSLLKSYGLEDCHRYAESAIHSFNIVSRYQDGKITGFYCSIFITHFFGFYMVYDILEDITRGICWCRNDIRSHFVSSLSNLRSIGRHPFYPVLACIITFSCLLEYRLKEYSSLINSVEQRTGYQGWGLVALEPAQGTYSELSASVSGLVTSLAANTRVFGIINEMFIVIDKNTESEFSQVILMTEKVSNQELFNSMTAFVKRRVAIQHIARDLTITRAQNQITALFNLINRDDVRRSIEIAKDSRLIASASKRDSSSMKALAAVTVVFLPGTFVAALFSMSMFDWQSDSQNVLSSGFWIYWAITLPLTFVTIGSWLVWTYHKKLQNSPSIASEDRELTGSVPRTIDNHHLSDAIV